MTLMTLFFFWIYSYLNLISFLITYQIVSKSANLSETNYTSLSKEATILKDHSKRACKCWMWIMIGIVMIVFICKLMI